MTTDEAKQVLGLLTAAYPREPLTTPTAQVWAEHLRDITAANGVESAHTIVATDKWFPSLARFREVSLACRRRDDHKAAIARGLPQYATGAADTERTAANLAALREVRAKLDATKTKKGGEK